MARQRTPQRRRRSRERTQLGENRPRALRQRVQRRAPADQELLDRRTDHAVGRPRRRGRDRDDAPATLVRAVNDLAAERRLPDTRRAAHQQRRRPATRHGPQLPRGIGELDLATDEHPLAETNARGAAGHTTPVSRHRAARPARGPSAIRRRSNQRIATCRRPASIAARISSRHAASSVGSTSISRSQSALRRNSSASRAWTRRRGSWVHASYARVGQQLARALRSGSRTDTAIGVGVAQRQLRIAKEALDVSSHRAARETARHAPSAARSPPGRPTFAGRGGPPYAGWPHRPRRRGAAIAARRPDRAQAGGRRQGRAAPRAPAPAAPANRPQ